MGGNQSLLNDVTKVFNKGNKRYLEGDLVAAKTNFLKCLTMLKNSEINEESRIRASVLGNIGTLTYYIITIIIYKFTSPSKIPTLGSIAFIEKRYEDAKDLFHEAIVLHRTQQVAEEMKNENDEAVTLDEMSKESVKTERSEASADESVQSIIINLQKDNSIHHDEKFKYITHKLQEHAAIDTIIGDACNNLGAVYEVQGDLSKSRKFYDESLQIRKLVNGERSYKVAESYQNLATVLDYQGYLVEAELFYHDALSIFSEIVGEISMEVALILNNLGILMNSMGQLDKSEEFLLKSNEIRRELSIDSEDTKATCEKNLEYVRNKRESLKRNFTDLQKQRKLVQQQKA